MFEFAISQNRKRPPTKRFIVSWILSSLAHAAALIILIENPGLLRPGSHNWIRLPALFEPPPSDPNWRMLTHVVNPSPLQMPSAETLKRALYSWKEPSVPTTSPPIRVRWGNETVAVKGDTTKPVPIVRPELGTQEPKPLPEIQAASKTGATETTGEGASKTVDESKPAFPASVTATGTASDKKPTTYLPAPDNSPPRQIPKRVPERAASGETGTHPALASDPPTAGPKPSTPAQSKNEPTVFPDKKGALRTEGSGLFDTKGFPLGEYAHIIIERIKGNWSIPSNLRHSQGRSTLIFFIEKDGSVSNLHVVDSSGSQSLDLAALSAILASKPLPPLPGGFPGEHVGAKFVFSYNEP